MAVSSVLVYSSVFSQCLQHSSHSIVLGFNEARFEVIVCFVDENTRFGSEDIAGIEKILMVIRVSVGNFVR